MAIENAQTARAPISSGGGSSADQLPFYLRAAAVVSLIVSVASWVLTVDYQFEFGQDGWLRYVGEHRQFWPFLSLSHFLVGPIGDWFDHSMLYYRFSSVAFFLAGSAIAALGLSRFLAVHTPYHLRWIQAFCWIGASEMAYTAFMTSTFNYYIVTSSIPLATFGLILLAFSRKNGKEERLIFLAGIVAALALTGRVTSGAAVGITLFALIFICARILGRHRPLVKALIFGVAMSVTYVAFLGSTIGFDYAIKHLPAALDAFSKQPFNMIKHQIDSTVTTFFEIGLKSKFTYLYAPLAGALVLSFIPWRSATLFRRLSEFLLLVLCAGIFANALFFTVLLQPQPLWVALFAVSLVIASGVRAAEIPALPGSIVVVCSVAVVLALAANFGSTHSVVHTINRVLGIFIISLAILAAVVCQVMAGYRRHIVAVAMSFLVLAPAASMFHGRGVFLMDRLGIRSGDFNYVAEIPALSEIRFTKSERTFFADIKRAIDTHRQPGVSYRLIPLYQQAEPALAGDLPVFGSPLLVFESDYITCLYLSEDRRREGERLFLAYPSHHPPRPVVADCLRRQGINYPEDFINIGRFAVIPDASIPSGVSVPSDLTLLIEKP